jgi:hypothetical protein
MDYGFAPGTRPEFKLARRFLAARPNTKVLDKRGMNAVKDFFQELAKGSSAVVPVTLPVDDLYLIAHGNDKLWMSLPLTSATPRGTQYEDAESLAGEGLHPTTSFPVKLPDSLNHTSDGDPTTTAVNIRGCRIGATPPMVDELRKAFGAAKVTAPRHFYYIAPVPQGILEYLVQGFMVVAKKGALKTRDDVVAAFAGYTPAFTFADGTTPVPAECWDQWIPGGKNFVRGGKAFADLNAELGRIKLDFTYKHVTSLPFPYDLTLPPGTTTAPNDPLSHLRDSFDHDIAVNGHLSPYSADHPVPYFKRFELATLDDFITEMDWKPTWHSKGPTLSFSGTHQEYTLEVPITVPPWDPATKTFGTLLFNFFPVPAGAATQASTMPLDPTTFYTAVAPAP